MQKETIRAYEMAAKDCLDRASACTIEADDDLFRLCDHAEKLGKICIEAQKLENERALEEEKLKLEQERLAIDKQKHQDDDVVSWKFWMKTLIIPVGAELIILGVKDHMIVKIAQMACEFEKDNSFTTSMGRGIGRFVQDSAQNIMRGR